jgi:GT2 family glycosyltransferase
VTSVQGRAADVPFCSIIVPTHARPDQLAECLGALSRLDYPKDQLEVIVVDDGGGVPLAPILGRFQGSFDVKLLEQQQAGPADARNAAARQAAGEVLAFTDDDCQPAPDWLSRLVATVAAGSDRAAGGHTVNRLRRNLYARTSQLIIDVGYGQNNRDPDNARFFTTNNLVVPAAGFRTLGGFKAGWRTSEDRDFCDRWVGAGFTLVYDPGALVHHAHHLTFRSFCRQHFAYGRGAYRFHYAHARRYNRQVRIEPSFYAALFLYPFRHARGVDTVRLAGLLQIWNLVNTAGFVWEWLSTKTRSRPAGRR